MKPEFNSNEGLSALSAQAHLMAEALLGYADDEGYFNANPELVRAGTCPLRADFRNISGILQELSGVDYIRLGTANGKRYGRIVKFLNHQKISHPSRSKIKPLQIKWDLIPENSGVIPEYSREILEISVRAPEILRPDQGSGIRELGSGSGDQGKDSRLEKIELETATAVETSENEIEDEIDFDAPANGTGGHPSFNLLPLAAEIEALPPLHGKAGMGKYRAEVKAVFAYYLETIGRSPKMYTLTAKRQAMGVARFAEALKMAGGDLDDAIDLMKAAIDEMSASDFHMGHDPKTNGKTYCEWEHVFRSAEQFQKWLQTAQENARKEAGSPAVGFSRWDAKEVVHG